MTDGDWTRASERMSSLSIRFHRRLPNLTLMEIRAKARRLKHRSGLRLVVVVTCN